MDRRLLPFVLLAAAAAAGCAASFRLAAPVIAPAQCRLDEAIVGTWTDVRLTQLGPAWEKLTLRCDCSYSLRVQLLWFRFTDRGQYRAIEGAIQFERQSGRRAVPYRLEQGALQVTDAPGEVITYNRQSRSGGISPCR